MNDEAEIERMVAEGDLVGATTRPRSVTDGGVRRDSEPPAERWTAAPACLHVEARQ